jgi:hypothetical protein
LRKILKEEGKTWNGSAALTGVVSGAYDNNTSIYRRSDEKDNNSVRLCNSICFNG